MALRKWEVVLRLALRLARRWPEVRGVDYGPVYKHGRALKTLGIRFHLGRKKPLELLLPTEVLPREMEGMRCDVLEARYSLQAGAREVCNPIQPGVSIGNLARGKTGTLGIWVQDVGTGASGVVSNWHVLCGSPAAQAGEPIGQPGPDHLGTQPERIVGKLERWVPLNAGADAALALLGPGIAITRELFGSAMAVSGLVAPRRDMVVVKYGVTTGLTQGVIEGIGGAYEMNYAAYGDPVDRWMDGFRIVVDPAAPVDEISLQGDSGAIWVERASGRAVGLHFAGEDGLGPTAEYALAQPIGRVLRLLGVALPG